MAGSPPRRATQTSGRASGAPDAAAKAISSRRPLSNKPKPMTVKFTKAGSFTFYCAVHPGMKGSVRVVAKSRSVPSAKADAARVAKQVAAAKTTAKALPQTKAAANSIVVAPQRKGGVEYFGFAPGNLTVAGNAGVLYGSAHGLKRFPSSGKVTFDTSGTYTYYCLIHPFMTGTVTVQ